MKKFYFLLFMFTVTLLNAQNYRPLFDTVNVWHYTSSMIPVVQPDRPAGVQNCFPFFAASMKYFTDGDSVINGLTYKRLFADLDNTGNNCHQGYVREDTALKQVYFMDTALAPERMLYDFSMQVSDSIFVNSGGQFDYFPTGNYVLDSITSFQMISGITRAFYLHYVNAQPFSSPLIWLEGVGFPGELVYDLPAFNIGGGMFMFCTSPNSNWYTYDKVLTCFSHDSKVYFDSCAHNWAMLNSSCFNIIDSCNYFNICGSVHELASLSKVKIQPNPAVQETTLELDMKQADELTISLLNTEGKLVFQFKPEMYLAGMQYRKLDVSAFAPGIYLVKLEGKSGVSYSKLVKM